MQYGTHDRPMRRRRVPAELHLLRWSCDHRSPTNIYMQGTVLDINTTPDDLRGFTLALDRATASWKIDGRLPFQDTPITGDCRISGICASLAGLEKALREEGENEVELAVRRILLIHGIILTAGEIPLIYLGDEIGTLND